MVAVEKADYETALCAGAVEGMRDRGGSFLVPSEVLDLTTATDEAQARPGGLK